METSTNGELLLERLTDKDAEAYYRLYTNPEVSKHFGQSPFLPDEIPLNFTSRIIANCAFIWTIRLQSDKAKIIGNAALHHHDKKHKTIEIGGLLLPQYWGKNLMKQAFELIINFARQSLEIEQITGRTSPANSQAIRMVEKLGFRSAGIIEDEMIMRLHFPQHHVDL